jgi:hypothetical protein
MLGETDEINRDNEKTKKIENMDLHFSTIIGGVQPLKQGLKSRGSLEIPNSPILSVIVGVTLILKKYICDILKLVDPCNKGIEMANIYGGNTVLLWNDLMNDHQAKYVRATSTKLLAPLFSQMASHYFSDRSSKSSLL